MVMSLRNLLMRPQKVLDEYFGYYMIMWCLWWVGMVGWTKASQRRDSGILWVEMLRWLGRC